MLQILIAYNIVSKFACSILKETGSEPLLSFFKKADSIMVGKDKKYCFILTKVALRKCTPNNLRFAPLRRSLCICQFVAGVSKFCASSQYNIEVP